MNISSFFSKETLVPWLRQFLQRQQLFVFIGVIIYALFAALKQPISFAVVMVIILVAATSPSREIGECSTRSGRRLQFAPRLLAFHRWSIRLLLYVK